MGLSVGISFELQRVALPHGADRFCIHGGWCWHGQRRCAADRLTHPHPDKGSQWPGVGVVRVFDWMRDNRLYFWSVRETDRNSIVFAGDLLTAGWSSLAKDFAGSEGANCGIGGDVSRGLLFRFREDVLDLDPKAIVILIGTNDLTAGQPARETLGNIETMLTLTRDRFADVPVVICTVPPSAASQAPVNQKQREELNSGLKSLALRWGCLDRDLFAATAAQNGTPDPKFFAEDLLHLSAAGYRRWKQTLAPILVAKGATR